MRRHYLLDLAVHVLQELRCVLRQPEKGLWVGGIDPDKLGENIMADMIAEIGCIIVGGVMPCDDAALGEGIEDFSLCHSEEGPQDRARAFFQARQTPEPRPPHDIEDHRLDEIVGMVGGEDIRSTIRPTHRLQPLVPRFTRGLLDALMQGESESRHVGGSLLIATPVRLRIGTGVAGVPVRIHAADPMMKMRHDA